MTTISQAQKQVAQFHEKLRVLASAKLGEKSPHHDSLIEVLEILAQHAKDLETTGIIKDCPIALRLHLELEELAEKFEAMLNGDLEKAVDGAADQLYVQIGTAAIYDWPLEAAFDEVHKSNITKSPSGPRVRDKGANYVPPDIAGVLTRHEDMKKPHLSPCGHPWCEKCYGASPRIVRDGNYST